MIPLYHPTYKCFYYDVMILNCVKGIKINYVATKLKLQTPKTLKFQNSSPCITKTVHSSTAKTPSNDLPEELGLVESIGDLRPTCSNSSRPALLWNLLALFTTCA